MLNLNINIIAAIINRYNPLSIGTLSTSLQLGLFGLLSHQQGVNGSLHGSGGCFIINYLNNQIQPDYLQLLQTLYIYLETLYL